MTKTARPIEGWLQQHWRDLFGYALALTKDRETARDLLQQAAVQALAAGQPPSDTAAARAWLFKIVRNAWIDEVRRKQMRAIDDDPPAEAIPENESWNFDDRMIAELTVRQGLERLEQASREVIELVDLFGFRYAEAAIILNLPVGTVMSRLSRARLALLEAIAESNVTLLHAPRRWRQRQ